MRWHAAIGSLISLAMVMPPGCSDDDGTRGDSDVADAELSDPQVDSDATPETDTAVTEIPVDPGDLRFDLTAALGDDFFAFPYPSDLRTNLDGSADLASFPTWRGLGNLLARAAGTVEAGGAGFSPLSVVYFTFERSLDPATLPVDAASSVEDGATAFIVDITPGSPSYGERAFATVVYNDEGGGYWAAHTLAIAPLYAVPLRPSTTYAAVVTTAATAQDGSALEPPSVIAELDAVLGGAPVAEGGMALAESLAPLHAALGDLGVDSGDLLAATVFTTSDPMSELRDLRNWMQSSLVAPTATGFTLTDTHPGYAVYEGRFDSVELFEGEAPYRSFGSGLISLDDDGEPAARTDVDLTFALSVPAPDGELPPNGWPVLLYGHGLGEDHRGFLRHIAGPMAKRGMAVLGISPPLQGDRNPTDLEDRDLITQLAVANIVAGREILRQGVLDEIRAVQLVEAGLEIPANVAAGGTAIELDPDRMAFMGHSEGAQIGALLLPLEPSLQAGVFSAGGGGGAITMLELVIDELDVGAAVANVAGIEPAVETFDLHHPVVSVVIQPLLDSADPLHSARTIVREPADGLPRHLVMTEGFDDPLTPPTSTEALVSAIGLPIAQPVGRVIDGLELQGVGSVALPISQNLHADGSSEPTATGALLQFPEQGHYVIYFDEAARAQLFDFIDSTLTGSAELDAAPTVD